MPNPDTPPRLFIIERERLPANSEGQPGWKVDVKLDDDFLGQALVIRDTLIAAQHERCVWYLEEVLVDKKFWVESDESQERQLATVTRDFKSFRESLFNALKLSKVSNLHEKLEINVCEGLDMNASMPTVHSLWWEQLETPSLWPDVVQYVNVRRAVFPKVPSASATWSWKGRGLLHINILLVISRKFSEKRAISPAMAEMAILEVRNKLAKSDKTHRIRLEIVRPGTFDEFKRHLEWRRQHSGPCYYHIVHFDVHGATKPIRGLEMGREAFLLFMDGNERDKYDPVSATDVATVLKDHQVACAVINSCSSARSDRVFNANLSQIFISHRVTNVLGMSYRFTGSAAHVFNAAFYSSFLYDEEPFSRAVHAARSKLRKERKRQGSGGWTKLEDWFIPVSYIRGVDKGIRTSLSELSTGGATHDVSTSSLAYITQAANLLVWCLLNCLTYISYMPGLHVPSVPCISVFSTDSDELELLGSSLVELNSDVLILEIYMVQKRLIYFNGLPSAKKTSSLRSLSHYWIITGFIDHVVYIDSTYFMENWIDEIVRNIRGEPSPNKIFQLHQPPPQPDEDSPYWVPRMLIIIDHIDDIFEGRNCAQAEKRFHNLLSKIKETYFQTTDQTILPYIILVGQKEMRWWTDKFRHTNYGAGMPMNFEQPLKVHRNAVD